MKKLIFLFTLTLISASNMSASQQEEYGNIVLENGNFTVVHSGLVSEYNSDTKKATLYHGDVIRVGDESKVIIYTLEKTKITLGSNAVLQVEEWKKKSGSTFQKGFVRLLFGRFLAKTTGLRNGVKFRMKTSTVTVGIKGTTEFHEVASNGATQSYGIEGEFEVSDNNGNTYDVPPGTSTFSLQGNKLQQPFGYTSKNMGDPSKLKSSKPNLRESSRLPSTNKLLKKGFVTEKQVKESDDNKPTEVVSQSQKGVEKRKKQSKSNPFEGDKDLADPTSLMLDDAIQSSLTKSGSISIGIGIEN